MRTGFAASIAAAVVIAGSALSAAGPAQAAPAAASEHQRIVDFWTVDKVRQAKSRDFVLDPATGQFALKAGTVKPAAKPVKPGSGSVLAADWTGGGLVQEATGKVLFALNGSYWVCSATATKDSLAGRTIITTAGHCVYDNELDTFGTNWMFIPNYDANPVGLDAAGSFCAKTTYGCWTAEALIASKAFADEAGFTSTATLHDYAFAVVGAGGNSNAQLDGTVGAQAIDFGGATLRQTAWLFGYPQASPYGGTRLIYSSGQLGTDPKNANLTYRVGSAMTGGSSGGPWFQPFGAGTGAGTQFSVTSYGYDGQKYLHGPVFTPETQRMFAAASKAKGGTLVS